MSKKSVSRRKSNLSDLTLIAVLLAFVSITAGAIRSSATVGEFPPLHENKAASTRTASGAETGYSRKDNLFNKLFANFNPFDTSDETGSPLSEDLTEQQPGVLATGTGSSGEILTYRASSPVTIRGVDVRFDNLVRASNDIVISIRKNGTQITDGSTTIFGYGASMNAETNDLAVNLELHKFRDVTRRYWTKTALSLAAGDVLTVVITSGTLPAGTALRATAYETLPTKPFANNLDFMLPSRFEGPVSNDNFPTMPTRIADGNSRQPDQPSHVQNNSNIIRNPYNGKLIAVPSLFTVDEQHDGQGGLKSRLFLFQSKTYQAGSTLDAQGNTIVDWENMGVLVDLDPNSTDQTQAVGDAHLSYDSEGNVICIFNTVNGINDVTTRTELSIKWIRLDKNTGVWSAPATLYNFKFSETTEWVYCPRLVYDADAGNYVLVLNVWYERDNRHFRLLRLDSLSTILTKDKIRNAPVIIMNNEEGGGMWKVGKDVFISSWQVPGNNIPKSRHAIYKAPLAQADQPSAWKPFAHSGARNEPNNAFQDGGFTADACNYWVEEPAQKIYRTCVGWGNKRTKNYLVWSQSNYASLWREDAAVIAAPHPQANRYEPEATATVDIPLASNGSFKFTVEPLNPGAFVQDFYVSIPFGINLRFSRHFFELRTRIGGVEQVRAAYNQTGLLARGKKLQVEVIRHGAEFTVKIGADIAGSYTVTDAGALAAINDAAARWNFQCFSGSEFEISDVTILDLDASEPTPAPTPTVTPAPTPNVTPTPAPSSSFKVNLSPNAPPSGWTDEDAFTTGGTALDYEKINNLNVSTAGVTNPAPAEVYKTARYTNDYQPITVTIGGFSPGEVRTVRLHLCEPYLTANINDRRGNYSINGVMKLRNYSIFEAAGGVAKAVVPEFQVAANQAGQFVVSVVIAPSAVGYSAILNGVEVVGATINPTPTPPPPTVTPTPSATPTPRSTPTVVPTPTATPLVTPTPTVVPIPTPTVTPTPTAVPTPTVTPTPIILPTPRRNKVPVDPGADGTSASASFEPITDIFPNFGVINGDCPSLTWLVGGGRCYRTENIYPGLAAAGRQSRH